MTLHHSLNLAAASLALTLVATPAFAAGIALREGSTDWIANAFAGRTAKAYDAGTVLGNRPDSLDWTRARSMCLAAS